MNTYRIKFEVVKEYDPEDPVVVGEYWATIEAETPEEAEKKAQAELESAMGGRHRYRLIGTHDMPNGEGPR